HEVRRSRETDRELLADAVVEQRLAGGEAAVDPHRPPDQPAGRDRSAEDVEVATLARGQGRGLEAEGDLLDGAGEEEGEQAERQRLAVAVDVGLDGLEDGARDVRPGQRRGDETAEQLRGGPRALLLEGVVGAQVVDRRAEAQKESDLAAIDA